jgi:hypothetical protein
LGFIVLRTVERFEYGGEEMVIAFKHVLALSGGDLSAEVAARHSARDEAVPITLSVQNQTGKRDNV